ncbi:GIY-YIG nuclease family protein [Micromonospora sp. NPDC020750]|uniref:GIY-YIG nuclease family protein n=1 Tax=unclassified Micromonospora TaxID=2617518 RepID=UPI00379DE988
MTTPSGTLTFASVPAALDTNRPEGQEWRHLVEGAALAIVLTGGTDLLTAAVGDLHPAHFNGDHRTICETFIRMHHEGADLTAAAVRSRLAGSVNDELLRDVLTTHERMAARLRPDEPIWLQRENLNSFLYELRREETVLYFWYDAAGVLLYIGITRDLAVRQTNHAKRSSWSVFARRCEVEPFPSRREAEVAEKAAIEQHRPLFNRQHNDTPEARARLVAYLIEHGRVDLLAPAVSRG